MGKKIKENPEKEIRVKATSSIWWATVAITAVSIPLAGINRQIGVLIPFAAIGGAAVGTVAVWRSKERESLINALPPQQVELLEQRLANLEAIATSNDLDLQMKIKHLEANNGTRHRTKDSDY